MRATKLAKFSMLAAVFGLVSCSRHAAQPVAASSDPIRLSGIVEPAELLIAPQKKIEATPEISEMLSVLQDVKKGDELSRLPAVDAYIKRFPDVGDMYSIRAELRCMKGDLTGARNDIDQALSGKRWLDADDPGKEQKELISIRAKLFYLAGNDPASLGDVERLIDFNSSDLNYLTDGHVKPDERGSSVCVWTPQDVESLVQRTHRDRGALLFRALYYTAFTFYDRDSRPIAERYLAEAIDGNPRSAEPYFYSAVEAQKAAMFGPPSEADASQYNQHLIDLYSKAISLDPQLGAAYADRADVYLTERDYQRAIADYDQAIRMEPENAALWNDRGLAKEETYDKSGAVDDLTRAIELKASKLDDGTVFTSQGERGDLYMRLGAYKKAAADYTTLIGIRLRGTMLFMNLEFFRKLYPEYAQVDDARLRDKLRRMYYPNISESDFQKRMDDPQGMRPSIDRELPEAFLKRADALLAMKDFRGATVDYRRSQEFPNQHPEIARWRQTSALPNLDVDLQTLDTSNTSREVAWVRSSGEGTSSPTEVVIDCLHRTVRVGGAKSAVDPYPGSAAEEIRDYVCSADPRR